MLNGSGLRVVLWVSGCEHHCENCHNPQTWTVTSGIPFSDAEMNEIREVLDRNYISGITLSGGDPLHPANIAEMTRIVKTIKAEFPDKDIWMYTGSTYEDVASVELVQLVDVLVDGEYVEEVRDVNAPWVGSTNQRVIDVQKSLAADEVVLLEEKRFA